MDSVKKVVTTDVGVDPSGQMTIDLTKYAWVFDEYAWPACITHISGSSLARISEILQVETVNPVMLNFDDAGLLEDVAQESHAFQVEVVDDDGRSILTVEPYRTVWTRPELIEDVSRDAVGFVSIYWDVNALMTFISAKNGLIIRSFDALLYNDGVYGDEVFRRGDSAFYFDEEGELGFGDPEKALQSLLWLFEVRTGVTVDPSWLYADLRPTYRVEI